MKFYSEITKQLYSSEKELHTAEAKEQEKINAQKAKDEARAARAKEVEEAMQKAVDANKKYLELRNQFIKDYGSFHMSVSSNDVRTGNDLFDFLFNL